MEMVLRALAIYLILLVVFKIAGRRALLQMTSFDLILLLISAKPRNRHYSATIFLLRGRCLP